MIPVHQLAELEISAASGVVRDGPKVYVVADDELFLDGYSLSTGRRTDRVALFDGALPETHRERKRLKPDLESLTWLPDRRLLILGSGSTAARDRGVVLAGGTSIDGPPANPRVIDLSPLYAVLRREFPALNIEGAAAAGPWLRLLQRRNGRGGDNAVIDLDLAEVLRQLDTGALDAGPLKGIHAVSLGELDGVPLGFTDASPLDSRGHIAFVAAAEDTEDTYHDGACAGSVLGVLDPDGRVAWVERIEGTRKIEGVDVAPVVGVIMVADPDDRTQRAPLLEAAWPWATPGR